MSKSVSDRKSGSQEDNEVNSSSISENDFESSSIDSDRDTFDLTTKKDRMTNLL